MDTPKRVEKKERVFADGNKCSHYWKIFTGLEDIGCFSRVKL